MSLLCREATFSNPITSTSLWIGYPFTISLWVKPLVAITGTRYLFTQSFNAGSYIALCLSVTSGVMKPAVDEAGTPTVGPNAILPGRWHHMLLVCASAVDRSLYVNGVMAFNNSSSLTPAGTGPSVVGGASTGLAQPGYLAEIAIWNVALSAKEIDRMAMGALATSVQFNALKWYAPLTRDTPPSKMETIDRLTSNRNWRMPATRAFMSPENPPVARFNRRRMLPGLKAFTSINNYSRGSIVGCAFSGDASRTAHKTRSGIVETQPAATATKLARKSRGSIVSASASSIAGRAVRKSRSGSVDVTSSASAGRTVKKSRVGSVASESATASGRKVGKSRGSTVSEEGSSSATRTVGKKRGGQASTSTLAAAGRAVRLARGAMVAAGFTSAAGRSVPLGVMPHLLQAYYLQQSFSDAVVATAAGIDPSAWPGRVYLGNAEGTLIGALNRGRIPAIEIFHPQSSFDKRGYWGGIETLTWRIRVHVGGIQQATAQNLAHAIMRKGLAVARAIPTLRNGNVQVAGLTASPFGHYLEATIMVASAYAEDTYDILALEYTPTELTQTGTSAQDISGGFIAQAFANSLVADSARVDLATWGSRILRGNAEGTLIGKLHRGRLPAVEVFQDATNLDKRGYWGGVENGAWRIRVHCSGKYQEQAITRAHYIMRAALAVARSIPQLRHGNATIGALVPSPFGYYLEATMEVRTMVDENTYELSSITFTPAETTQTGTSAQSIIEGFLVQALSNSVVATAAGISLGEWATRVMRGDNDGTLIASLHRGRLPAVEVFQSSTDFDKRGYWGGVEGSAWQWRVHVGDRDQDSALVLANGIIRAGLAAGRSIPQLRHGSARIGALRKSPFGYYIDAIVEVRTMVDETTYEAT